MSLLTIVVPTYRESGNIVPLLSAIEAAMRISQENYEVVFVDDGSPDDTWAVLQRCCAGNGGIRALRFSRNFGKEAAIAAGLDVANGDAVVVMDADLQHPPSLLPEMIRKWKDDKADVVECVKSSRGEESVFYKVGSHLFYQLIHRMAGVPLKGASDFKLLDKTVVQAWRRCNETNVFFRGLSHWLGFRRAQVLFDVPPRSGGRSGWTWKSLLNLALTGITAFSSIPLHLVTIFGWGFFVFAIVLSSRAVYLRFHGQVIDGITTVIVLNLFIGSLIMISLGIMGEYISRLFEEVKNRPRYILQDRLNVPNDNTPSLGDGRAAAADLQR